MSVTIYHNPKCGTSRNTLAMIRASGVEPRIIEYLADPPTRERLKELLAAMGMPARERPEMPTSAACSAGASLMPSDQRARRVGSVLLAAPDASGVPRQSPNG